MITGTVSATPAGTLKWSEAPSVIGMTTLQQDSEIRANLSSKICPLKFNSTEANPKHTYQKTGKYRADLEVKDAGGDSDSDYLEIDVQ